MRMRFAFKVTVLGLLFTLAGCGGGGGSSPSGIVDLPEVPPPPPSNAEVLTRADIAAASRFASRTTFGMPYEAIEAMAKQGVEGWLEEQFALPFSSHVRVARDLIRRRDAGEFTDFENGVQFLIIFWRVAWWNRAMTAPDQLRQRVAFALSEIFVVSDVDILRDHPYALTTYNDMLGEGAFGNFRELLKNVALHPATGNYLSHINNRKAIPEENIFPDENFAREVMQLFSIGLFELNIDGTYRRDANGELIPTYDNSDIGEFAKIFTGLSYGGPNAYFGKRWPPHFQTPMQMFEGQHDRGEKKLLNAAVVPAGQSGMADIDAGLDNLFNHPNVGPFIGKQLIQRLVTSNPAPQYVERVARAFNGETNGGIRGDMKTVLEAILLDPEARYPANPRTFGKLREPVLRLTALARQFNAECEDGLFFNNGYRLSYFANQHPLHAPSVFNFFLPTHSPPGDLAEAELVAPEFQITTATTIVGMTNQLDMGIFPYHNGALFDVWEPFAKTYINIDDYVDIADNVDELLDRLDLLMTYDRMSHQTKTRIRSVLTRIGNHQSRAEHAIYLVATSPDYAVET